MLFKVPSVTERERIWKVQIHPERTPLGADVNFSHLDLTNTCWIRAVQAADGSVLVMAQCTDEELDEQGSALKAIMASLAVDE